MTNFKYLFGSIFTILILSSCGYKVLDKSRLSDLSISSIETTGNKKINFLIKNKIRNNLSDKFAQNIVRLSIDSSSRRSIKEKNIKNEITKYQINISTKIQVNFINKNVIKTFNLSQNGDYSVSNEQSKTISNRNNLERYLVDKITNQFFNKLILITNDL